MFILGVLWLILSYLLGSFPSGYLISRFSGKNILKIGWEKTSGSNVFKNVGIWQGIFTGILDIAKGFLAVFGAQKLGLSLEIQIFSGLAAISGHNWSCFLKLAGGRGIATLFGAFLFLEPKIFSFSLIPMILLSFFWDSAIGTLFFFPTAIFLSRYFNQFEPIGVFSTLAFLIILIKRLSPIKEIKTSDNPKDLIKNRLIFDDDKGHWNLRVKRMIKKSL